MPCIQKLENYKKLFCLQKSQATIPLHYSNNSYTTSNILLHCIYIHESAWKAAYVERSWLVLIQFLILVVLVLFMIAPLIGNIVSQRDLSCARNLAGN